MGLIRLFLASVVAMDHWRALILSPRSIFLEDSVKFGFNSGYAVMFFYVISGFLITYTLSRNYDRNLSGTLKFYKNRFIRIFSLYWPLVIVALLVIDSAWDWFVSESLLDKFTGIFLIGMDWRIAFASQPDVHPAINGLGQAWTLGAELTFYLMAPLLMHSWKIGAILMVASFGLRMAFVIALGPDVHEVWTYRFFPSTLCFFLFGYLICLASLRWSVLKGRLLGGALLSCSLAIMTFGSYQGFDSWRFWSSTVCFVVAMPAVFEVTKNIRWMNLIGDLSYPLYLVHYLVLILVGTALADIVLPLLPISPTGAGYLSVVAFLVVSIMAAAAVHRIFEIPVAHLMRRIGGRSLQQASPQVVTVVERSGP
jgi:peptidoglycan/LPS O-acetylase OafA/YrhL